MDYTKSRNPLIIPLVSIGVIVLLIVGIVMGAYNGLIRSDADVDAAWAKVESTYQRRAQLIPQVVEVAKQATKNEKDILTEVVVQRAEAFQPNSVPGDVDTMQDKVAESTSILSGLVAISEEYPEIKSNENWVRLQDEIAGSDNRVFTAINDYITSVNSYNKKIRTFPNSFIANMFGFEEREQFSTGMENYEPPVLDLGDDDL